MLEYHHGGNVCVLVWIPIAVMGSALGDSMGRAT